MPKIVIGVTAMLALTMLAAPTATATTCAPLNLACASAGGGVQTYHNTSTCLPNVALCHDHQPDGQHSALLPGGVIGNLKGKGLTTAYVGFDACATALTGYSCNTYDYSTGWPGPARYLTPTPCMEVTATTTAVVPGVSITDVFIATCG